MRTLKDIDSQIAALERQLEKLNEERRELINYNSWNKKIINGKDFTITPTYEAGGKADGILVLHTPSGVNFVCKDTSIHRARAIAMEAVKRNLLAQGWTEPC